MKDLEGKRIEKIGYSVSEFAKMVGLSETAVRMLIFRKSIPAVRLGRRVLIPGSFVKQIWEGKDGIQCVHKK